MKRALSAAMAAACEHSKYRQCRCRCKGAAHGRALITSEHQFAALPADDPHCAAKYVERAQQELPL